jgi:hypothetical protein
MKLPVLAELNAIGLRAPADRALLAAHWLKIATVSSPAVVIVPEVPAIAARAEVIAQTAKPLRPQTPIVPAAQNTTGFTFGQLYLNSPAYPAGTQIPAIPQKPASAEVIGVAAVVGVPKVPAVISPKIDALKGWEDAIQINKTASNIEIIAYLPYASSPLLVGSGTSSISAINEMTMPALNPGKWLGSKSSATAATETSVPPTVEQYFYKQAQALVGDYVYISTIENSIKLVNGVVVPCKKITLNIPADGYNSAADELQLDRIGMLCQGDIINLDNIFAGKVLTENPNDSSAIALVAAVRSDTNYQKFALEGIWFNHSLNSGVINTFKSLGFILVPHDNLAYNFASLVLKLVAV